MKKVVLSLHITLDGFAASINGKMDWVKLDDELFDVVNEFTIEADTALYGRKTYNIMEAYWPNAGNKADASKHDKEHSTWYNSVEKIVVSRTLRNLHKEKTSIISDDFIIAIKALKEKDGGNIIVFGSLSIAKQLIAENMVDVYWLFINPVILGEGISFLPVLEKRVNLKLISTRMFACGVTALHYEAIT